ncbi:hypothetical protein F8M41_018357 [Gigaspora margarita]|uniref:Uncharacterized protein n=1 Tax=Gigaspora margarita TaxID=4874 RepID=A0A8H4ELH7_GIGMA|nr:hypothetical protein F8M41_018357 [Gigaspora margarita]
MPVLKFYLDLYYDDFGTFQNTYYSLEVFTYKSGNDIAGMLHHNANFGWHSCKASKNELMNNTFDIYSNGRYQQITNQEFKNITRWVHLPNFISHRHSFMMSDILHLLMILPFILKQFLTIGNIKSAFLNEPKARLNLFHNSDIINCLIRTWELSVKASKNVFSSAINRSSGYYQLQETLDKELNALIEAILNTKIRYYQNASYSIVESNGDFQDVRFCIGEAVETTLSNDGQPAFGVVKEIIEHK